MKRNVSAVRDVLLYLEDELAFTGTPQQVLPSDVTSECDEEEIAYAIYLLLDCGFLDGAWEPSSLKSMPPLVRAITSAGHEFLELVRDEETWALMQDGLAEVNSWNIEVLVALGKQVVERRLSAALEMDESDPREATT